MRARHFPRLSRSCRTPMVRRECGRPRRSREAPAQDDASVSAQVPKAPAWDELRASGLWPAARSHPQGEATAAQQAHHTPEPRPNQARDGPGARRSHCMPERTRGDRVPSWDPPASSADTQPSCGLRRCSGAVGPRRRRAARRRRHRRLRADEVARDVGACVSARSSPARQGPGRACCWRCHDDPSRTAWRMQAAKGAVRRSGRPPLPSASGAPR
jgi:hypothetical protein